MSKRAIHLEVKAKEANLPVDKSNEILINRFLKACSKESLLQMLYEKSSYTKRFTKKSVVERQKRLQYRRNAQKATSKKMSDNL
jgi:hypothetical protein